MKFYPPKIIRFYYRYVFIFVLVVLPLFLAVDAIVSIHYSDNIARLGVFSLGIILMLIGCFLVHIGFWEKFFSTLILTDSEIRWVCPFRHNRVMSISECIEIGIYIENENKGIPSQQIYFSNRPYPQRNMDKNGVIKPSQHFIKFWYSKELSTYLIDNYPSNKTSCLNAYMRRKK